MLGVGYVFSRLVVHSFAVVTCWELELLLDYVMIVYSVVVVAHLLTTITTNPVVQ
jgi:hypothetical protein